MTALEKQLAEALEALALTDEIQQTDTKPACDCKFCTAWPKVEAALAEYRRQNQPRQNY